jgi:hypothetical protein
MWGDVEGMGVQVAGLKNGSAYFHRSARAVLLNRPQLLHQVKRGA